MLNTALREIINGLDIASVTEERKAILQLLIDYIKEKKKANLPVRLNFICTHNSRRSHLSQIWAQTMAYHFNIKEVNCYSGGTEATALFPVVVETLKNKGFNINRLSKENNPVYSIKYALNEPAVIGFSKIHNNDFNPKSEFAAIMTCSQADEGCPLVYGCEKRIAITYEDPKVFDSTPQQAKKYNERSLQIATEMYYVFSFIN